MIVEVGMGKQQCEKYRSVTACRMHVDSNVKVYKCECM